jgi:hypothetical protein
LCIGLIGQARASEAIAPATGSPTVILVVGAPGEAEYGQTFQESADLWQKACLEANATCRTIGLESPGQTSDLDALKAALHEQAQVEVDELWLVFLGHGTFDGKEAKFNLRGPDLSATQLGEWLANIRRPLAIINTSSSSAPFLNKLSKPGRIVITATRSGYEQNYTRFGQFFSRTIADLAADLDKDGQVSLLEAFLMAAHHVAEFYKTEGRLASEHALLDDNGDTLGTPPDWFRGVRAVKRATEGTPPDGRRAHQFHLLRSEAERRLSPALRQKRNELELAIEGLRESKPQLDPEEYYKRLEGLLLELARLYQASESLSALKDQSQANPPPSTTE